MMEQDRVPPTVSVVIPTYNHRDLVLATMDSVFAQTFLDYEVIVVVDGSPDDSAALLEPLAESGQIRLFVQENRGQAHARNAGWRRARGEFVAFLDDDDLWPPDRLEWQVDALRKHPDVDLVYGDFAYLGSDETLRPNDRKGYPSGRVEQSFRLRNWMLSPGQATIRRSALERCGGFDPEILGIRRLGAFPPALEAGRVSLCRSGCPALSNPRQ